MRTFILAQLLAVSLLANATTLTQLPEPSISRANSALEITSVTPEFTSIRFHDPAFEIGELMWSVPHFLDSQMCSDRWGCGV